MIGNVPDELHDSLIEQFIQAAQKSEKPHI